jgi:3-hydroxyisobutyrate dehydrogenase-like beta-hydroxyacid dehydrogenase
MKPRVRIYGNGRSGSAYARRLTSQGVIVSVFERSGDDVFPLVPGPVDSAALAILALPRGSDVPLALRNLDVDQVDTVVDLTTQSPQSAANNAEFWFNRGGIAYHAGGSNGGERAVLQGRSFLLIGPRLAADVAFVLGRLGAVTEFDTLEEAVTLKLCHNAMLVARNEMAKFLTEVCSSRHIPVERLARVIDEGPAGRSFLNLTAIRQMTGGYDSSYIGEYAAKDWQYFQDSLTESERQSLVRVFNVGGIASGLLSRGRAPWI